MWNGNETFCLQNVRDYILYYRLTVMTLVLST